jgi:hypothetical protein
VVHRGHLSTEVYRKYRFARDLTRSTPDCSHGSSSAPEPHAGGVLGASDASVAPTLLRPRGSQADGCCLPRVAEDDKVTAEVRTFETTTASLLGLRDWLTTNKCTHVAMEATGVYWKSKCDTPATPAPTRIRRRGACQETPWPQERRQLAHGLIRASFVPDTQTQELRGLLRTRKQLVRESSSHIPASTEGPRGCQHQIRFDHLRFNGHERTGDDRGDDCRRD